MPDPVPAASATIPLAPGDNQSAPIPGQEVPPAAAAPAAPPEPAPAAPDDNGLTFRSQEQLNERLERAVRSHLKKLHGTDDEEAIKAQLAAGKELQSQAEEQRRAEMTERDKLQEDLTTAQADREAAEANLHDMQFNHHISTICAQQGIKNVEYAGFLLSQALDGVPDGQELDCEAHLKEFMETDQGRAALGMVAPAVGVADPATTTPDGSPRPPAPAPGGTVPVVDANNMTAAQFAAHKATLGI